MLERINKEQALRLKKYGYKHRYAPISFFTNESNSFYDKEENEWFELPYLEEVLKWFREGNKIVVVIDFNEEIAESFEYIISGRNILQSYYSGQYYTNYETAQSEAINKVLELIDHGIIRQQTTNTNEVNEFTNT